MALWLRDLSFDPGDDETLLPQRVAVELGIPLERIVSARIVRRSLDARKKQRIRWVLTVEIELVDESGLLAQFADDRRLQKVAPPEEIQLPRLTVPERVLVVGMGPAGLFAAKWLAESGLDVTLVERGRPVEQRVRDVEGFWSDGTLNVESNVQFGEGGAGTFSDGKLTTRLKHPWRNHVLETLVELGAPEQLLIDARPHVGTDCLRRVVIGFRERLLALGVKVKFESCLTDLELSAGRVTGGMINDRDILSCDRLVLAPGHSARDTYAMLDRNRVQMEAKSFAVGVRVEHPTELINAIQYGANVPAGLPTADYALRYNDPETGRGIYSFCMCPGGEIINAASESGGVVVNGMSRSTRSAPRSNSALVVSVSPDDWEDSGPLGGVRFQQHWEQRAFQKAGGNYRVPVQNLMTFLGRGEGPVDCSCRPGGFACDMSTVLPSVVSQGLRRALPQFDRQMRGFVTREAVIAGVETRTSAPLRLLRDEQGVSLSHGGLYPSGEGAGYAGGIMSAALDGLRTADRIIQAVQGGSHL